MNVSMEMLRPGPSGIDASGRRPLHCGQRGQPRNIPPLALLTRTTIAEEHSGHSSSLATVVAGERCEGDAEALEDARAALARCGRLSAPRGVTASHSSTPDRGGGYRRRQRAPQSSQIRKRWSGRLPYRRSPWWSHLAGFSLYSFFARWARFVSGASAIAPVLAGSSAECMKRTTRSGMWRSMNAAFGALKVLASTFTHSLSTAALRSTIALVQWRQRRRRK